MASTVGFDPAFLPGVDSVGIPPGDDLVELTYTHFSVLFRVRRRLAAITGVNIDGARLVDVDRDDNWTIDPRLPATDQAGPDIYRDNALDRGHLVRRLDPVWGEPALASQANRDTFHYTVCAPQTSVLNQSHELWVGLEDYILDHAATYGQKLSVFTGCLFTDADPIYRGLAIPRRFFQDRRLVHR